MVRVVERVMHVGSAYEREQRPQLRALWVVELGDGTSYGKFASYEDAARVARAMIDELGAQLDRLWVADEREET